LVNPLDKNFRIKENNSLTPNSQVSVLNNNVNIIKGGNTYSDNGNISDDSPFINRQLLKN
jgi:hypothetical protein